MRNLVLNFLFVATAGIMAFVILKYADLSTGNEVYDDFNEVRKGKPWVPWDELDLKRLAPECEKGNSHACSDIAFLYDNLRHDFPEAELPETFSQKLYSRACRGGFQTACQIQAGTFTGDYDFWPPDLPESEPDPRGTEPVAPYTKERARHGYTKIRKMIEGKPDLPWDQEEVRSYFNRCMAGEREDCIGLGFRIQAMADKNPEASLNTCLAVEAFETSCLHESSAGCYLTAWHYQKGDCRRENPRHAYQMLQEVCNPMIPQILMDLSPKPELAQHYLDEFNTLCLPEKKQGDAD